MHLSFCETYATNSLGNAVARFRFTDISQGADDGYVFEGGIYSKALEWSHCAFWNFGVDILAATGLCLGLTNNSFQGGELEVNRYSSGGSVSLRNNLFRTMHVVLSADGDTGWILADNLFDQTTVEDEFSPVAATHNAYFQATNGLTEEEAPIRLTDWTYQPGPLGPFYQPTNSPLFQSGSLRASDIGLFHFASQLTQQKAGSNTVSVGVHYAALETNLETSTVWFDDNPDANWATWVGEGETWSWITNNPPPASGTESHRSTNAAGLHQHYFYNVPSNLALAPGDRLFCYVYLYSNALPSTVMLQWRDETGDFAHRAFWGQDQIGWAPRLYAGPLPATGGWMRLETPVEWVGMDTHSLNGLAFTLSDGYAVFDAAGKSTPSRPLRLCDSDGDGLPDVMENRSGTGQLNPALLETDWQTYTTIRTNQPQLQVFTPLR